MFTRSSGLFSWSGKWDDLVWRQRVPRRRGECPPLTWAAPFVYLFIRLYSEEEIFELDWVHELLDRACVPYFDRTFFDSR